MTDSHPFLERLRKSWPPEEWAPCGVLAAVSGGADSVALLRGLHALAHADHRAISVAHLDHGLRGSEGAEDAEFVRQLADELSLKAYVATIDVRVEQRGGEGMESAARRVRYRYLRRTAEAQGARYVAVAHTADDQAETVLHRLFRGAGLHGLAGMPRARPLGQAVTLIRPALELRRQELRDYLTALGQPWCEDRTNADPRFTRNRLRRRLLPLLEQDYGPSVAPSICRAAALAAEAQAVIHGEAERLVERAVRGLETNAVVLRSSVLSTADPLLVREALRAVWRRQGWPERSMGFAEWTELSTMILSSQGPAARMFPGGVRAEKRGDELWLIRLEGARGTL